MRYEAIKDCDIVVSGTRKALWRGIVYSLDADDAAALVASGALVAVETRMMDAPPTDKAIDPPQNKRRGGRAK